MDTLPIPLPYSLTVFCGSGRSEPVAQVLAELAVRGPLAILDGGNRFPAYHLIRLIRSRTPDPAAALQHTSVRRAFTCYQMLAMLEGTPALPQPYVILDLLTTFYDEQVPLPEVRRLLEGCLRQVERLCRTSPVLVTASPPPSAERAGLVEQLCERASQLYAVEMPALPLLQPALF
ncbi:MAG: hypothetical protein WCE68_11295 [Anaerolineales bacterium]